MSRKCLSSTSRSGSVSITGAFVHIMPLHSLQDDVHFKAGLPTRATCAAWTFTTTSDYFQNIRRTFFNISHYWVELAILHLPTPIQWIDVYVT